MTSMKPNLTEKLCFFFCAKKLTVIRAFFGYVLFHRGRSGKLTPMILTMIESECKLDYSHVSFAVLILYFVFYLAPKKQ